jgi:kinesin family protein 11
MADMASQMAALDQFVTRACSQNDLHHQSHTSSLATLGASVNDSYSSISSQFTANSDRLSTFGTDTSAQAADLYASLSPLDTTVRQPLSKLRKDIEAAPLTEYTITGETPQKTNYTFPNTLPKTQSHDKLLSRLKRSYDTANADDPSIRATSASPSKSRSPSKALVYHDSDDAPLPSSTSPQRSSSTTSDPPHPATALGLREVDANVLAASTDATVSSNGMAPPPLKRHATTIAVDNSLGSMLPKLGASLGAGNARPVLGRENQNQFSSSLGPGGRRLK